MSNRTGSARVAFCGVMAALALVFLLLTAVPVTEISLALLAGIALTPVVIECGRRYALGAYIAVSLLSLFLVPALEGKVLFIAFFGYYSVLKAWLEEKNLPRTLEWGIKLAVFNAATVIAYWLMLTVFHLDSDSFTIGGVPLPWVFLLLGNVVFLLYEWCLTRLIARYMVQWRRYVRRLFRF